MIDEGVYYILDVACPLEESNRDDIPPLDVQLQDGTFIDDIECFEKLT